MCVREHASETECPGATTPERCVPETNHEAENA
jgi:hypothetical protein